MPARGSNGSAHRWLEARGLRSKFGRKALMVPTRTSGRSAAPTCVVCRVSACGLAIVGVLLLITWLVTRGLA